MRFSCLACDYDGTLAKDGVVSESTVAALRRLKDSGRKLILVTGRELEDLGKVFPELTLFDLIVAENGAVAFRPADCEERVLAEPPPREFVAELRRLGVELSVGRAIVATWRRYLQTVTEVIRKSNLELRVILNKNAVMVLPPNVNKATGLRVALDELGIAPGDSVGVGDAENDEDFLAICGASFAVANALPELKAKVTHVTRGDHGVGVEELIQGLLSGTFAAPIAP